MVVMMMMMKNCEKGVGVINGEAIKIVEGTKSFWKARSDS